MLKSGRFTSAVLTFVEVPKTIKKREMKQKLGGTKAICYEYFLIFSFSAINLVQKIYKGKDRKSFNIKIITEQKKLQNKILSTVWVIVLLLGG